MEKIYTVSELTDQIKITFKNNFQEINITGEISNFKLARTNAFFMLRDDTAGLNCVIWEFANNPEILNGSQIKASGYLTLYNKNGTYNLNIKNYELVGLGNIFQDYIKLKNYFTDLGYFAETRKKALPDIINKIGILTAADGAALQDIFYILKKNQYKGLIYIQNCLVQGRGCPSSLITGLEILDKLNLDLIILTRGGGSFEDLFGFSDKLLIEAIFKTKTLTISAVGHEVDFSLSDFVSDIRAPTPSVAAELISRKSAEILNIQNLINNFQNKINKLINQMEYNISLINHKIIKPEIIFEKINHELEYLNNKLNNQISNHIRKFELKISNLENQINIKILNSIITDSESNPINSISQLEPSKKLKLIFPDGHALVLVKKIYDSEKIQEKN